MILSEHQLPEGNIICVIDEELIGSVLEEGAAILDLSNAYYAGVHINEHDLKEHIKTAHTIHAIGKKSISCLKTLTDISADIKTIQGVPHVQVVLL